MERPDLILRNKSLEHREKVRSALRGRKFSNEHKLNLSKAHYGMKKPWVKGRILGYKVSQKTKEKISNSHKGLKKPWAGKYKRIKKQKINIINKKRKHIRILPAWNKGIKGFKHTEETKKKISEIMKKRFLGKIKLTSINIQIRSSFEYKLWRESVFKRDNWTCVWCKIRSQKGIKVILHADHIKPFALFPELRFAIDNGRTLCVDCHKKTDTYLWKAIKK